MVSKIGLHWPFHSEGKLGRWHTFFADGFERPVSGCIYKGGTVNDGVPLGGLGTGYITLDGNGSFGKCSCFNSFPEPMTLNAPFFAITHGKSFHVVSLKPTTGTQGVKDILYWGHFPFADLKVRLKSSPLQLGIRAFSPFILGDANASNTPCILFEIHIFNDSEEIIKGNLIFSFPGPKRDKVNSKNDKFERHLIDGKFSGVAVTQEIESGYTIVTDREIGVKTGLDYGTERNPWYLLSDKIRIVPKKREDGASISVEYELSPKREERLRFALAWYYPYFIDSSGEPHKHHYASRFKSASEVAIHAMSKFDDLLNRTLTWQRVIYDSDFPLWLKDGLINSLYSLAKNTLWVINERPDNWYPKIGFFTHSESFTGCPITETMVCRIHGHFPILFFFPELERSTLSGFKHFQLSNGEIPFCFGAPTSLRDPRYHCQHPLNSGQYVQIVYRYYLRTEDRQFLEEFYESVKKAVYYQKTLDYDDDGLVNEHSHALSDKSWPANQFYDIWPWYGTSAYVAGTWLATLTCARKLAEIMGDDTFAKECHKWFQRGRASYEKKLWNGKYYRLYNDPETHGKNETCLGNQLMGEWCVRVVGRESILPNEHLNKALDNIQRLNFKATKHGLVNGVNPDGTPAEYNNHSRHIFFGESLCAAMTFIYNGRKELGMEIAKRLYEAIAIHHRTPWNQRCLINSKDGGPVWGSDYYSNMVIWALPMALSSQGMKEFCQKGIITNLQTEC